MYSLLMQWAKIAGIAGMAFGTLLIIYRAVLSKLTSPDKKEVGGILRLIVIFTFAIGVIGLLVYAAIMIFVPSDQRSPYKIDSVVDTVDFSCWNRSGTNCPASPSGSTIVRRTRRISIRRLYRTDLAFQDRNTTTGTTIVPDFPNHDATYSEVSPASGHTSHEYLMTVGPDTIGAGDYELQYTLTYVNGWKSSSDNWVAKPIQYPTENYKFILHFPTPWKSMTVKIQPPGATQNIELASTKNWNGSLTYEWQSPPHVIYKPGTRLIIFFDWPPLTDRKADGT